MNLSLRAVFLTIFVCVPQLSHGANILGLFTFHVQSHLIGHMAIVQALVEKGHNVTVITTLPLKDTTGFHHVQIPMDESGYSAIRETMTKVTKGTSSLSERFSTVALISSTQFNVLKDPKFLEFLHGENKFDLMILGYFINEFQLGVAAHFKCPVVISWTGPLVPILNTYIGNPAGISYVPSNFGSDQIQPMAFVGRVKNFLMGMLMKGMEPIIRYSMNKYYVDVFPADKYPPLADMTRNISLVLSNNHFSAKPIRANVPALIEIGGIQSKEKPEPLDKDLAAFLNTSTEHGAIFFSLGSNVHSADMSENTIEVIYNVLSSLKQKVIWKWNSDKVPGTSKNIFFRKWLPQDDILAHPATKLFITHGGKGSITEAQFHGVPMVGLPVYGDQLGNINGMVDEGYGIGLDYPTLTEESFRRAILEVLENPKYSEKIKGFSTLYRDRPMTAKQTAVYWCEYVIRHRGAAHMQSPLLHMNLIEYLSLDVLAFLAAVIFIIWKTLKLIFKAICGLCRSSNRKAKRD